MPTEEDIKGAAEMAQMINTAVYNVMMAAKNSGLGAVPFDEYIETVKKCAYGEEREQTEREFYELNKNTNEKFDDAMRHRIAELTLLLKVQEAAVEYGEITRELYGKEKSVN